MPNDKTLITVEVTVRGTAEKVWEYWTRPEHIVRWSSASDDWHTPKAENDPRTGGSFKSRMEAKDGSAGFDFSGTYDEVRPNEFMAYTMDDGRKVTINFNKMGNEIKITETFEAESENPIEMQKNGWQSIMNNFKKYLENS